MDVLLEDGAFLLRLRNHGDEGAHEVRCAFDQPLLGLGGQTRIDALGLFTRLEYLAPGREIAALLDSAPAYLARGQALRFAVTVDWRDDAGRAHRQRIVHDLTAYADLPQRP